MSKRSIIEIMDDMDRLEKIEITDELADTLKDYFKDEIDSENLEKEQNEKVAKGLFDDLIGLDKGNNENGQSDRV
ncbi:MAG: hypothetical protein K2Q18_10965 [Bdellovibrionales bacterium]|nr:hypothetical protein [Bdellovibrionales bacterium]